MNKDQFKKTYLEYIWRIIENDLPDKSDEKNYIKISNKLVISAFIHLIEAIDTSGFMSDE